jgi:hypothetical protein
LPEGDQGEQPEAAMAFDRFHAVKMTNDRGSTSS